MSRGLGLGKTNVVSYLTFLIQSNQGKTKRVSAKYLRSRFRESKRAFLGETTKRVCEILQGLGLDSKN